MKWKKPRRNERKDKRKYKKFEMSKIKTVKNTTIYRKTIINCIPAQC